MFKRAYGKADFLGDAAAVLGAGARGAIRGHAQMAYDNAAYMSRLSDRYHRDAAEASAAADALRPRVDEARKAYHDFRANSREAEILRQAQARLGFVERLQDPELRARAYAQYHAIRREYERQEAPYERRYHQVFNTANVARDTVTRKHEDAVRSARGALEATQRGDATSKGHVPALVASALMGGAPVGDHTIATPLLTFAGQLGAEALFRKTFGPGSSHPVSHGVAAGAGAALARLGLRGYDSMVAKKPLDKKPREKKSYDLADILGDVAASGLGGASAALAHKSDLNRADAGRWRAESDRVKHDYYDHNSVFSPDTVRSRARFADASARVSDRLADGQGLRSKLVAGGQGLSNFLLPVGDHNVLTPLLSGLGTVGAAELLRHYAPGSGTPAHGAAGAAGALLGRLGLRAFDHVTE